MVYYFSFERAVIVLPFSSVPFSILFVNREAIFRLLCQYLCRSVIAYMSDCFLRYADLVLARECARSFVVSLIVLCKNIDEKQYIA
jgi:hypothetical protein